MAKFHKFEDQKILNAAQLNSIVPSIFSAAADLCGAYAFNSILLPALQNGISPIVLQENQITVSGLYAFNENGFPFFIEEKMTETWNQMNGTPLLCAKKSPEGYYLRWESDNAAIEGEHLKLLRCTHGQKAQVALTVIPRPYVWKIAKLNTTLYPGLYEKYETAVGALRNKLDNMARNARLDFRDMELMSMGFELLHFGEYQPTGLWLEKAGAFAEKLEGAPQEFLQERLLSLNCGETSLYLERFAQYLSNTQPAQPVINTNTRQGALCFESPSGRWYQFDFEPGVRKTVSFNRNAFRVSNQNLTLTNIADAQINFRELLHYYETIPAENIIIDNRGIQQEAFQEPLTDEKGTRIFRGIRRLFIVFGQNDAPIIQESV